MLSQTMPSIPQTQTRHRTGHRWPHNQRHQCGAPPPSAQCPARVPATVSCWPQTCQSSAAKVLVSSGRTTGSHAATLAPPGTASGGVDTACTPMPQAAAVQKAAGGRRLRLRVFAGQCVRGTDGLSDPRTNPRRDMRRALSGGGGVCRMLRRCWPSEAVHRPPQLRAQGPGRRSGAAADGRALWAATRTTGAKKK